MRSGALFFTASVLINAAMLYSVDHASVRIEKDRMAAQAKRVKAAQSPSGPIAFEYVESPKAPSRKPLSKTRRISDRDSANQDMTADKSSAQGGPQVKMPGLADQLAQKKGNAAPPPVPASPEIAPTPVPPAAQAPLDSTSQAYSPAVKASQPTPPSKPDEGRDRITTTEMSKMKSGGAQLQGITSFEATGSGMGVYMKNLKEKIWLAWYPYLVTHYPRDFKSAEAVLSFKLNARGEVKIVELVEHKGSSLFAAFCMESVQRAGSFGPLPPEILALVGKDELEIKFAFRYS